MGAMTLAAALTLPVMTVKSQQIDPITQAMINGLSDVLKENPDDYYTLYDRAAQYYRLSMYDQALNDLQKALRVTPGKDAEMINSELTLLADVNTELKDYEKALECINKALEIKQTYPNVYKKGNILLYLNRPEEAYRTFSSLQRMKSRSQEAYFGMAKSKVMTGDAEEAKRLLREAQEADPTNYLTFCRVGDLYVDLGEDENAAANYLSAFSLSSESTRPLQSLVTLASRNYTAFANAIDYALSRTNNKLPLYFLKGNIAYNSGNFSQAREALGSLLSMPEGREGFVYARQAEACRDLNLLSEAQTAIDLALIHEQSADNYLIKSEIELALGNSGSALMAARKATSIESDNTDAMVAEALANVAFGDAKEALRILNEAVMTNPSDMYPLMVRAWLQSDVLKDEKSAVADYARGAAMEAEEFPDHAYRAMARYKSGKILDADAMIEKALRDKGDNCGKDDYFWAGVYYAQTGNLTKSKEMVDKAKALGYQNEYRLKRDTRTNLTVAPVRHLIN